MNRIKFTTTQFFLTLISMIFSLAAITTTIRAQFPVIAGNNFYSISDSPASPTLNSDETKFSFVSLAVVNVTNIEELYAAVNNSANTGNQIVIAPGVYILSINDGNGIARPNGGRLELQENMSLRGVQGDREAVVIDAINLPTTSYNSAPPIPLTGAVRMGKGSNSIEWLTVRNAVNGAANIETELFSTGTAYIRIAHIASSNSQRGIDVRNFGAAQAGRVIEAEIVDNDLYNNRIGTLGEGLRIVNNQGANGGRIIAGLSGNRSYYNYLGLIVENNRSNSAIFRLFHRATDSLKMVSVGSSAAG
jgi:hypothetical protein